MKLLTVIGTRPEIIRLSILIKKLDKLFGDEHIVINTQQNFKNCLNEIFLKDFQLREANYNLNINEKAHFSQISKLIAKISYVFEEVNPDYLVILGDTNSAFASAYVAQHYRKKYSTGVPIFHMEAGNRSFDARVPEESNRTLIDNMSTVNMCYTERHKENLVRESLAQNAYVTGNPQLEILNTYSNEINASNILETLHIGKNSYILVTLHRAENIAYLERIHNVIEAFKQLSKKYDKDVIVSCHPRMRDKMDGSFIEQSIHRFQFIEPVGFFDWVKLQQNAFFVASDSGTVPEECTIQKIPNIILRESTERIEIIENASSLLVGTKDLCTIIQGAELALENKGCWDIPSEYLVDNFSQRVISIMFQYISGSRFSKNMYFGSKYDNDLTLLNSNASF